MPSIDDYLDRAAAASSTGQSTGGSSQQQEPSVFWASEPRAGRPVATKKFNVDFQTGAVTKAETGFTPSGRERTKPLSDARMEFYRWSDAERAKWGDHLLSLGLIDDEDKRDFTTLNKAWVDVVDETANFTAAGKKLTPWQVASLIAGGSATGSGKKAGFSGTKSQTSRSVDLTDPHTAKALVNDVLAKTLGRAATDEELEQFRSVLNTAERSNPTNTTSTTTYTDGDATAQSSTTSGGLNAAGKQQVLLDSAMQKPDYGAFQAATTYYNILAQAIGSPV